MLCAGIEPDPLSSSELQVAAKRPKYECLPKDLLLCPKMVVSAKFPKNGLYASFEAFLKRSKSGFCDCGGF
jgi:hypothetical protein